MEVVQKTLDLGCTARPVFQWHPIIEISSHTKSTSVHLPYKRITGRGPVLGIIPLLLDTDRDEIMVEEDWLQACTPASGYEPEDLSTSQLDTRWEIPSNFGGYFDRGSPTSSEYLLGVTTINNDQRRELGSLTVFRFSPSTDGFGRSCPKWSDHRLRVSLGKVQDPIVRFDPHAGLVLVQADPARNTKGNRLDLLSYVDRSIFGGWSGVKPTHTRDPNDDDFIYDLTDLFDAPYHNLFGGLDNA